MVRQAEEFAEKDRERAELIQARNTAESLAYEAERVLTDQKEKLSESEATGIRDKVKAVHEVVEKKDATAQELRERTDELTRALHAVAQKLYQSTGPTPPGTGGGEAPPTGSASDAPPPSGSGPVDADYKVVDSDHNGEKSPP